MIEQIEDKNFDTSAVNGQIIYKSPWGYSYVQYVNKTNDFTLIRPGFMWDYDKEDYIKHSPDEIYLPLKLSSFICTDLQVKKSDNFWVIRFALFKSCFVSVIKFVMNNCGYNQYFSHF